MVIRPGNDSLVNSDGMLAFDNIIIQKGTYYYFVPAFVIYLADAAAAQTKRENLAVCYAFITGHRNNNVMFASLIFNDLTIELTDPTYKLVSFELLVEDEQSENLLRTQLYGSKIPVEKDEVTRMLRKQRPGNTVTIENIKAEKNGKIYHVSDIVIYIK